MGSLKVTSWNIKWLDRLFDDPASENSRRRKQKRLEAIALQIQEMAPDILCVIEGPKGEDRIDAFCTNHLGGGWVPIKAPDSSYSQRGKQWVWFLVRPDLAQRCSLQPVDTWKTFAGGDWPVHYWGDFSQVNHRHYRHPQVLVLDWHGTRVEFIGLHLKSKHISMSEDDWTAGGNRRQQYTKEAIKARIKLTTEASNVRAYIDRRFAQTPNPLIFVLGDLNDGPGKEHFEQRYLFFDLISNIQGDVFFAQQFFNHALFDFQQNLRWSAYFEDIVDPNRDPHILLDHILFSQGLVDESLGMPLHVDPHAGFVEHEAFDFVNARYPRYATTSDHRPVSLLVTTDP